MSRVLVIGCGGVASVAIQKCCQVDEVFTEMCIASRTKEKCDALVEKLKGKTKTVLTTADQQLQTRSGDEHRTSLSGPDDHGCMSGMWCKLYGYSKL